MFCKNCGAEIDDKAVVCPKCGVAVKREEEKRNVSALSIVAFCISILAAFVDFFFLLTITGFVCSIIGVVRCKKLNQRLIGLGIAGIVISVVNLIYRILVMTVLVALF